MARQVSHYSDWRLAGYIRDGAGDVVWRVMRCAVCGVELYKPPVRRSDG